MHAGHAEWCRCCSDLTPIGDDDYRKCVLPIATTRDYYQSLLLLLLLLLLYDDDDDDDGYLHLPLPLQYCYVCLRCCRGA